MMERGYTDEARFKVWVNLRNLPRVRVSVRCFVVAGGHKGELCMTARRAYGRGEGACITGICIRESWVYGSVAEGD